MIKSKEINQIKENLTTTAKAIGCDDLLRVEFKSNLEDDFFSWNQNMVLDSKTISCPPIQEQPSYFDLRAPTDLALCYLMFHDKDSHNKQDYSDLQEQYLFDFFEKARVMAQVGSSYKGIVKNILAKVEQDVWTQQPVVENLPLVLLDEIFPNQIFSQSKELALSIKQNFNQNLIDEIKNLSALVNQQDDYALKVQNIIEMLRNNQQESPEPEEDGQNEQEEGAGDANINQENIDAPGDQNLNQDEDEKSEPKPQEKKVVDDVSDGDLDSGSIETRGSKSTLVDDEVEFKKAYKIFTSKYDEIVFPQKLVEESELEILRDQLDIKMLKLDDISRKMALKLKRKLMSKRDSYIDQDNSSGILNRKKLTQFVIDPFIEDIWTNNKHQQHQDTALTILLDNSGSMRGQPIVMSALACEIIAKILEKFQIRTEIIGFTTADWKGGKARKMWDNLGNPKNPGRLNELRHIIYKSSNQSFKKARVNLGLMLKEGILKENIDGEALLFAKSRLLQREEKRKILMVISDGTPIDDSTSSANDEDILSEHLQHVINRIEKQSKIEIVGVGIGHYTGEFYRNSITIKKLEELGDVMIEKLVDLF